MVCYIPQLISVRLVGIILLVGGKFWANHESTVRAPMVVIIVSGGHLSWESNTFYQGQSNYGLGLDHLKLQ